MAKHWVINTMVTSKEIYPLVGTILGNYFVGFDPLGLWNYSGLSKNTQNGFVNFLLLNTYNVDTFNGYSHRYGCQ